MAKSRPKKFSKQARMAKFESRMLVGLRLISRNSHELDSDGNPVLKISHKCRVLANLAAHKMTGKILRGNHHWIVKVFTECRTEAGEEYRDDQEFEAYGVAINELSPLIDPILQNITNTVNPNHVKDWGWEAEILPNRKQERVA